MPRRQKGAFVKGWLWRPFGIDQEFEGPLTKRPGGELELGAQHGYPCQEPFPLGRPEREAKAE